MSDTSQDLRTSGVSSRRARQSPKAIGSSREVYFVDFGAADPDDPACDITFPYIRS